jgi:hypothetical protein
MPDLPALGRAATADVCGCGSRNRCGAAFAPWAPRYFPRKGVSGRTAPNAHVLAAAPRRLNHRDVNLAQGWGHNLHTTKGAPAGASVSQRFGRSRDGHDPTGPALFPPVVGHFHNASVRRRCTPENVPRTSHGRHTQRNKDGARAHSPTSPVPLHSSESCPLYMSNPGQLVSGELLLKV